MRPIKRVSSLASIRVATVVLDVRVLDVGRDLQVIAGRVRSTVENRPIMPITVSLEDGGLGLVLTVAVSSVLLIIVVNFV